MKHLPNAPARAETDGWRIRMLSLEGQVLGEGVSELSDQAERPRGVPRTQYHRTYVLLPPDAGMAWAAAVIDAAWDSRRYTVGSSADDAGIGDLERRTVIAVNPQTWGDDLPAFFARHYQGVECVSVEAETPDDLKRELRSIQRAR